MMFIKPSSTPMPIPTQLRAPTISGAVNGTTQAGTAWSLVLSAVTYNSATPQWALDVYQSGMILIPSGTTATLSWTPDDDDVSATPKTISVSVSDGVLSTAASLSLLVIEAPEAGVLVITALPDTQVATFLADIDDDAADWVYYGPGFASNGTTPTARKDGVSPVIISDFSASQLLNAEVANYGAPIGRSAAAWGGGKPAGVATVSGMIGSFVIGATGTANRGYAIPIAASTSEERRALVCVSIRDGALGELSATCPGAPAASATAVQGIAAAGYVDKLYEIRFKSIGEGNLVVTWKNSLETGGAALRAIAIKTDSADAFVVTPASPMVAVVGQLSTIAIEYDAADTTGLSLQASGVPDGAEFSPTGATATLSYRPPAGADTSTPSPTRVEVLRGGVAVNSTTIAYSVSPAPEDPLTLDVGWNPFEVTVGEENGVVMITDGGTPPYRLSAWPLPGASSFDPATGLFEWADMIAADVSGTDWQMTVTLTDADNNEVSGVLGIRTLAA